MFTCMQSQMLIVCDGAQNFFYNKGKKTYAAWVISPFVLTCVFYSFILVYFYEFVYAKNNHELM